MPAEPVAQRVTPRAVRRPPARSGVCWPLAPNAEGEAPARGRGLPAVHTGKLRPPWQAGCPHPTLPPRTPPVLEAHVLARRRPRSGSRAEADRPVRRLTAPSSPWVAGTPAWGSASGCQGGAFRGALPVPVGVCSDVSQTACVLLTTKNHTDVSVRRVTQSASASWAARPAPARGTSTAWTLLGDGARPCGGCGWGAAGLSATRAPKQPRAGPPGPSGARGRPRPRAFGPGAKGSVRPADGDPTPGPGPALRTSRGFRSHRTNDQDARSAARVPSSPSSHPAQSWLAHE